MRDAATWFGNYSRDHQNPTNRLIHWICVPAITWTVVAFVWLIPVPGWLGRPGFWAVLAMFLAFCFYYFRLSRRIGLAMAGAFIVLALFTDMLYRGIGITGLTKLAIGVFVLAWIGQFIGHKIEGKKPSFFDDLRFLLIGPLFVLSFLYRRLKLSY